MRQKNTERAGVVLCPACDRPNNTRRRACSQVCEDSLEAEYRRELERSVR